VPDLPLENPILLGLLPDPGAQKLEQMLESTLIGVNPVRSPVVISVRSAHHGPVALAMRGNGDVGFFFAVWVKVAKVV
jgi:hypothetical protein